MKKIAFLPLAILLASAVFLACGGDDDDGGGQTIMGGVSLPVDTEINGLVSITSTNVRSGSTPVTTYPTGVTLGAYAFDDPVNFDPVAETTIRQDSTYSLTVNTLPGTVLYLYLQSNVMGSPFGAIRLDPVVVAGGNLRNDINYTRKLVTIRGSTSGYKEDGAQAAVALVQIKDPAGRILGATMGGAVPSSYAVDVEVPSETAVYKIFVQASMSPVYIEAGEVSVSKDAGGDITEDIVYDRKTTEISGTITYRENDAAPATGMGTVVASTSPSSDIDDFSSTTIGYAGLSITSGSGSYSVKITRGAAATVYLYAMVATIGSGPMLPNSNDYVYLGEVPVPADAATVPNKNFSVNNKTTEISGTITYREDGTAVALQSYTQVSVVDGNGENLRGGSVTNSGGSQTYSVSIPRPEAATTVYISYNGVKSAGISIGTGDKTKTANVTLNRSTEAIKGKIGGTGKSAIGVGNGVTVATSPYPVSFADSGALSAWNATKIGEAAISVSSTPAVPGEPYSYNGKITKLESNTHVYYYVQDSLSAYYKIGEADLAAGEAPYSKDFIIGLVNKKIVPGF
jgi:hypothetical protein